MVLQDSQRIRRGRLATDPDRPRLRRLEEGHSHPRRGLVCRFAIQLRYLERGGTEQKGGRHEYQKARGDSGNCRCTSGSFRPWSLAGVVCAGQWLFLWVVCVLPIVGGRLAGGCVAVDVEEVGEAVLGGGGVGEHAAGAGASFAAVVVEQDGLFDAGEFVEQFTH